VNLSTQCPQCGTQFQVSLAQLQLRKGFVRCVQCAHIFDGYETVVPESGEALPQAVQNQRAQPVVIRQRMPSASENTVSVSPDVDHTLPGLTSEAALDAEYEGTQAMESPAIYAERRVLMPESAAALPHFLEDVPAYRGWAWWAWCAASVLALLVLLAQGVFIYRVQLASQLPATRPWLERVCATLGCDVPYPRNLGNIAILNSALRMQPRTEAVNEAGGQFVLHLTLRNQDAHAQQWPILLLELTDFSGAVVIRKHLLAQDYLPKPWQDKPFAGKSELALRLPMAVQNITINGYQIRPFFP